MKKDSASIAPSEATTLVNEGTQDQPQGLLGNPIKHDHDNLSNVMLGDGGGGIGGGSVGVNFLPHRYTDKSLVRIPIRMSDVTGVEAQPTKKKGFFRRSSSSDEEIKVVMMARGDYLQYWQKGADGKFAPGVVEPPEGRQQWFENQLEVNKQWIEADPSLGKTKSTAGLGNVLGATGPAMGGA